MGSFKICKNIYKMSFKLKNGKFKKFVYYQLVDLKN